jgi:hypothetical protein
LASGGSAVAVHGVDGSFLADLSETAQFLGVAFFADAADTIPLPDVEVNSALGFDYVPEDALSSPIGAPVPEPSTWAMMLLGFAGLGYAAYRRSHSARPAV